MSNPTSENPNLADTLLFEQFAMLATAPDGIGRLRELILQLAVQGRLGTQSLADEPASELLERIKGGKKIKKGKDTNIDECQEEDLLYILPENWIWTKFDDIVFDAQSGYACGERNSQGIVQLRMNNINPRGDFIWEKILRVPFDASLKEKYELKSGDVVFNNTNSLELVGKSGLFKGFPEPIVFSNHYTRLRFTQNKIDPAYVTIWLHHEWNSKIFEKLCNKWIGQAAVNGKKLLNILFPLPPLAEQHRIVAKVDRLMALCDELEARQQQERAGCLKIGTASFAGLQNAESPEEFGRQWTQVCDAFALILDCPENVAMLRQTILQLAVQGKLGTQDVEDEPAGKLVERIRKEKERLVKEGEIGKTKPTPEIESEEISYSIPKNWIWTRLDNITYISTGSTPSTTSREYYTGGNIPWVTSSLTSQKIIFNVDTKITENAVKSCSLKVYPKGTILIALYGQGKTRGQVSELGISATINQACAAIVFWKNNESIKNYIKLVLSGNYEKIRSFSAGGAQPNLNVDKIKRTLIPLPPIAEQHRIVAKVDALMALCDQLEAQLKERAGMQGKFTDAVVKSIGTG